MDNNTDPFGHFGQKSQTATKSKRATSFLEAFKENSGKRQAVVRETGDAEMKPGFNLNVSELLDRERQQEQQRKNLLRERMLGRQREEDQKARFKARQKEVAVQIEQLREAILKIAKSTQNLGGEIEKAAFQAPVGPGVYHLGFFEKLKRTLEFIKQRIDESASWMQAASRRQKHMPYYWKQVKKSGTKYLLSQERQIATSVG